MGGENLAASFPLLHRLSALRNSPISDFIEASRRIVGDSVAWNFHLRRNLNDRETQQLLLL